MSKCLIHKRCIYNRWHLCLFGKREEPNNEIQEDVNNSIAITVGELREIKEQVIQEIKRQES